MASFNDSIVERVEKQINELVSLLDKNSPDCDKIAANIITIISFIFKEEHHLSEFDSALAILFRPNNSLLYFIEKAVGKKLFKSSVMEALNCICDTIFIKYKAIISKYVILIKESCYKCLIQNSSVDVKRKAYKMMTAIVSGDVSAPPGADLNISELVNFLHNRELTTKSNSTSQVAVEAMFELYGAIAKYHPEACQSKIDSLVRNILCELKTQIETTSAVKQYRITGCMLALRGILVNFKRGYEETPEQSRQIYSYIKKACDNHQVHNHRNFQRAALEVFACHMSQFWGWVLPDVRYWLNVLTTWASSSNGDDRRAGSKCLDAFHQEALNYLETPSDNSACTQLTMTLLTEYKATFNNPSATEAQLSLAIKGVGALALRGSYLSPDLVLPMFSTVLHWAQNNFNRESDSSCQQLAECVQALSHMCRGLGAIGNEQLAALLHLVQLAVQHFPQQRSTQHFLKIQPLVCSVFYMAMCRPPVIDRFLYPLVYETMVQTCSHCLLEEAEYQRELTGTEVTTYRDYLPLWKGFINMRCEKIPGISPSLKSTLGVTLTAKLYECMLRSLIEMLEKLEIGYKKKQLHEQEELGSDHESNLEGTKRQDHTVLCNLVNLYKDLMMGKEIDRGALAQWLPQLIPLIVKRSTSYPLVSAFYKLLAAAFYIASRTNYFKDEGKDTQALGKLLVKFLEDVMFNCKQYKDDLQASCLLVIVAVPTELISSSTSLANGIPTVIKTLMHLGQGYLPLALSGIKALKWWKRKLSKDQMRPILNEVLPSFDPYLRTSGILLECGEEEVQLSKKQEQQRKPITESTELSHVQEHMLKLLSQLDSSMCLSMLRQPVSAVAWTTEPLVTIRLPCPDQRPVICLDPLLPRVVELALTSSDRQTKAAACEVLHTCVILFTGHGVTLETTKGSQLAGLLRRLLPPVLSLACGSDIVFRQLFHPLVMQLAHWFSSPVMLKSPRSEAFLQVLWEEVTDEKNPALRDLCALTLKEYVSWSIRQTKDQDLKNSPSSIKAVIREINTCSVNPVLSKRIGAAIVFNHLSPLLRGKEALVDEFWVEMTVSLVKNLRSPGVADHPALAALDICQHGFHDHSQLFLQGSNKRRVPKELDSGLVEDVIKWLLVQCGSETAACALKCRQIVISLLTLIPGVSSLSDLVERNGVNVVEVCEGGGSGEPLPCGKNSRLRACLDCYTWTLSNDMIPPATLICSTSFITSITHFIETVVLSNIAQDSIEVIIALFDLLCVLGTHINQLPDTFWSQHLWQLISFCVFKLKEDIAGLCRLLSTLRDHLRPGTLQDMCEELSLYTTTDCAACLDKLQQACKELGTFDTTYVRGIDLLQRSTIMERVQRMPWNGGQLMSGVYACLYDANNIAVHPSPAVLKHIRQLLNLAIRLGADVKVTVSNLLNNHEVKDGLTGTTVTKGEHLLVLLEYTVFSHLLQDPSRSITILLDHPTATSVQLILRLLHRCKYRNTDDRSSEEDVSSAVIAHWEVLELWAGNEKAVLVELLKAVVLSLNPARAVGQISGQPLVRAWVFRQLATRKLDQLVDIISLLPFVIIHGQTDKELRSALGQVQSQFPVSSSELRRGSVERNTLVAVFKALLRVLEKSGSVIVLSAVSQAATEPAHVCAEFIPPALSSFMRSLHHEVDHQVEALQEMFKKFVDDSGDTECRLNMIQQFLVPLLLEASMPAVTRFYAETIQTIIDFLEEPLQLNDSERMVRKQLVRKTGALQLVQPLYSHLEQEELESEGNLIVRHAVTPNNVKLTKYFVRTLNNLRKSADCSYDSLKQMMRRLHCCAFNAMMTILCNTRQPEECFSGFIFSESIVKFWRKLVSTTLRYTFPISFDDYPKIKKEIVKIRSLARSAEQGDAATSYLRSQSMFTSTLHEDITHYDFSMYQVRDEDRVKEVLRNKKTETCVAMELEEDCLNSHECMATLCTVVEYLYKTFLCPMLDQDGQVAVLPSWMKHLRSSLTQSDQPENCRSFIVKLIVNCKNCFKPTASYWVTPILQAVVDDCFGTGLNYLIHDIVEMLCEWGPAAVPTDPQSQSLASEFLRRLVFNTPNEHTAVVQYNIEVIKSLVSSWKKAVSVPCQELLSLVSQAPHTGLLLADVFLSHNLLPFNSADKLSYYKSLLDSLKVEKGQQVYKACAVVIGKIFKVVSEKGLRPLQGDDALFFKQVQEIIAPKDKSQDTSKSQQFIYCLHGIQSGYTAIVKGFEMQCINSAARLNRMPGKFQTMLVEALTSALDYDFKFEAFKLLRSDVLAVLANSNNPDCQLAALKLVDKLMPSISPQEMAEFLPAVSTFLKHKRADCRAVVYSISKWIYDTYSEGEDSAAIRLRGNARSYLLAGLVDPDPQLQSDIYSFMNKRLAPTLSGRVVDALNQLYSPHHEETFLASTVKLLLQVSESTNEFNENIFAHPLDTCVFENHPISCSWRTQHVPFVPMFADTLTSQIMSASQGSFTNMPSHLMATFLMSSSSSMKDGIGPSVGGNKEAESRASSFGESSHSGWSFGQSLKQGQGFGSDLLSPVACTDGSKNALILRNKRILKNKDKVSKKCAEWNMVKTASEKTRLAERMKRLEGDVKLTRSYRKGDLPDIEIPHHGVIRALQNLAKRDQLTARQLLVAVCKVLEGESHYTSMSAALTNIMCTSSSCHPALMATVLELSLMCGEHCTTPASVIAHISKKSAQMSLGALLLEDRLLNNEVAPPPAKRGRYSGPSQLHQYWIHLAEIYRSMEEKDVVKGLFEDKIADVCAGSVRSALLAEDEGQWVAAGDHYKDCIGQGSAIENFLYEACFKCAANLSQWEELNNSLKGDQLENNLDAVWSDDWKSEYVLPWLFLSEIMSCQRNNVFKLSENFTTALSRWLNTSARAATIKERLGEYLSMVWLVRGDSQRSKVTCEATVQRFLTSWQQLDTFSHSLRTHHLLSLGSLMDLQDFLCLPPSSESKWLSKVEVLCRQWLNTSPSVSDSLLAWETRAVYRNIFTSKLEQETDDTSLRNKLKLFQTETYLKTADCALEQKNFKVTTKYLKKAHYLLQDKQTKGTLQVKWYMTKIRGCLLRASQEPASTDKLVRTLNAWDDIRKLEATLVEKPCVDNSMRLVIHMSTADVYSTLLSVMRENPSIIHNLPSDLEKRFYYHFNDSDNNMYVQLEAKVVASLQEAVDSSSASCVSNSYLKLTHFCHQLENSLYDEILIQSLLRAMKHESAEARRLFPCLLQLPLLQHQQLFIVESAGVAEWMFLGWVNQLLANLECEWGCVIAPLLLRLAEAFPVALHLPFLFNKELKFSNDTPTSDFMAVLEERLSIDRVTLTLVEALRCVCQPLLCLTYHLDKMRDTLSQGADAFSKAYNKMKFEVYPPDEDDNFRKGTAFKIIKDFKKRIEKSLDEWKEERISLDEFKNRLYKINQDAKIEFQCNEKRKFEHHLSELKQYSPWLVQHYDGGVEIPGQYTGERQPFPQEHLTIARFDRHVKCYWSIRAPIKITTLGNNGKKHSFLVKFGEDLRQDQRLQQLFVLMTHLLRDFSVGHRQLTIHTYNVTPLTCRLGLIEWVDRTDTIGYFMQTERDLENKFVTARKKFENWWKMKCPELSQFYNNVSREEAISVLHETMSLIPKNALRDAVRKLAASSEAFVYLRAKMVSCYGCMSVCHWLLGVGDRHLNNTLVQRDSGSIVGIDFGHAFGTATHALPVPELVPCRLTPQLVALAAPLNTTGLLKESMVQTLQVMRDHRRVLLAAMSVFILEPSVDWLMHAVRQQENASRALNSGSQWNPQERISEARRKLEGAHPRSITEKELEEGHSSKPHYLKLVEILQGAYSTNDMPEENLNSRQQVECVITQSTNEHILGISFYGWSPWI